VTASEDRIVQLAEKIRRFGLEGVDKTLSEQDTKAVLVEPLLELIGWDVHDPAQVTREDRPTERPVDYSLKIRGEPVVLVECKRLANRLDSPRDLEQALSYASSAGVRWCVLTNGCLFRIYNSLAEEVAKKKLLEEVDLARVGQTDGLFPNRAVQSLELISPQSIETGRIDEAWEQRYTGTKIREVVRELWREPDPGLVNLVRQRMKERGRTLSVKDTSRWLGTLDVKIEARPGAVPAGKTERKPSPPAGRATQMRIGSYSSQVRYSNEVLINTAEWLIQQGRLNEVQCPVRMGRTRSLINTEPKHRDGVDYKAPKELSNGLWLEANLSGRDCIRNARRLLKECGYSAEMLEVEQLP